MVVFLEDVKHLRIKVQAYAIYFYGSVKIIKYV